MTAKNVLIVFHIWRTLEREEGMKCLSEDELCFPFLKTIFDSNNWSNATVKGSSAPSVEAHLIARNDKYN